MISTKEMMKEYKFDITRDSQKCFDSVFNAFCRPGTCHKIAEPSLTTLPVNSKGLLSILLTMLDLETNFAVTGNNEEQCHRLEKYVSINTGSIKTDISQAGYVIVLDGEARKAGKISKGTLNDPHKGATLMYIVDSVVEHNKRSGLNLLLAGPGIKESANMNIQGLSADEAIFWKNTNVSYPAGIDILLIDNTAHVCAIPRSAAITIKKGD